MRTCRRVSVLVSALLVATVVRAQTSPRPSLRRSPSSAPIAQLRQDWVTALEASTVFAAFTAKIKLVSRSTAQSSNLAYDSGSYTETLTQRGQPTGNGTHALTGDYLTIYRHDSDGRWRIVQQVWTQAPPAPAARTTD